MAGDAMKLPMKWTHRDLGLRVFYRAGWDCGVWTAQGMGKAVPSWDATGERIWWAIIFGDDDPPVSYSTARECKIAILASMSWEDREYQE